MLILSRKVGETIVIGGRVLVTVTKVRSQTASLGIVAPPNISVDRSEVFARKEAEGESANKRKRLSGGRRTVGVVEQDGVPVV
jgi:carbon storage regulator